jgi:homoserine/homoserine lactone efflux protein
MGIRLVQSTRHTRRQQTALNRVFSGLFAAAAVVLSLVRRAAPA